MPPLQVDLAQAAGPPSPPRRTSPRVDHHPLQLAPLDMDSVGCLYSPNSNTVVPVSLRPNPNGTTEGLDTLYAEVKYDVAVLVAALVDLEPIQQVVPDRFELVSASSGYKLLCERRASGQVEQRWEWSHEGERVDWAACRWRIELLCSEEEEASAELDEGPSG
ncbi:hypothetical protein JCM8208_003433 [Rhodotorula glutinis]